MTEQNAGDPYAYTNKLVHETSPYLLQHAHNPVDWYPWGEEAIARAKAENKPIFLSIGYSACHWCHVMERESFENETIAAFLNEHFVSIKVDREERPDLDDIYMTAVQALTGRGGWPMSVFLTPELEPFYGGTYFPPTDRMGMPGFLSLLESLAKAWEEKHEEILKSAGELTRHIASASAGSPSEGDLSPALLQAGVQELRTSYDSRDGGWGSAPKFPSSPSIALLLREYNRSGAKDLLDMAAHTLDRMARGGMYDHLGGGFHRYSVDGQWLVPHFEKMLYDNAQLSQVYLEAYQLTGNAAFRRVAEEIFEYVLRDMRDGSGGFHSAEDADSEGEEGKFYVWKRQEIIGLLGKEDGALFCTYYNVLDAGNFKSPEHYHAKMNILHQAVPPEKIAEEVGMSVDALEARMAPLRATLLDVRTKRVRPALDDKVLTSWNALMITALAQGARILDNARYRDAAAEAGAFILKHMMRDGALLRTHRGGESRLPGYLDDYAFTLNAFVDLYEATFDTQWLDAADTLAEKMLGAFWDAEQKVFYFTEAIHKNLIVRTKPTYDGAEPSGNSMAALGLLRLAKLLDEERYYNTARDVLRGNQPEMARAPRAYLKMLCAADFLLYPPKEIALAGAPEGEDTKNLLRAVYRGFVPNKVVALAAPGAPDSLAERIPLLAFKTMVGGAAAAYVCRDFTCQAPTTDPEELAASLRE